MTDYSALCKYVALNMCDRLSSRPILDLIESDNTTMVYTMRIKETENSIEVQEQIAKVSELFAKELDYIVFNTISNSSPHIPIDTFDINKICKGEYITSPNARVYYPLKLYSIIRNPTLIENIHNKEMEVFDVGYAPVIHWIGAIPLNYMNIISIIDSEIAFKVYYNVKFKNGSFILNYTIENLNCGITNFKIINT